MAKIDILAEQTNFLFEKQKETLEFFKNEIESLEELVREEKEKIDTVSDECSLESFKHVEVLLGKEKAKTLNKIEKDVKFLEEQLEAIKEIQAMDDEKKADELCDMMLEDEKELPDTKKFKENVEEESEEAKQGFQNVSDDIKSILSESGIIELEAVLEARLTGEDETEIKEVSNSLKNKDEKSKSEPCSSCSECNIFEGLEEEDKDTKN